MDRGLSSGPPSVERQVLDLLFFRQISDRFEGIAKAHAHTFQWIFHDPIPQQKPWDNFKKWLEEGCGCYWISGKAGSGKSTLMKFIQQDPRTLRSLRLWSGQDTVMPAYFFYSLGSTLQKSHEGLLRSVLFAVLSRYENLVLTCFPDLYRAVAKGESAARSEPTISELKRAFTILFGLESTSIRICMFIDGIDEYEGDLSELLTIFSVVETSTCGKIVLASRPTPECTAAFSRYNKLRLQDLTEDDIKSYVMEHLLNHPHVQYLQEEATDESWNLIEDITTRASGVFLWVMLVVKSLLRGLNHYESLSDMRRRLEELPTDLKQLYQHMFDGMEPAHRQEGSKYLQIVLRSQEVQREFPMELQQLALASADSLDLPESSSSSIPKVDARQISILKARLGSRCCGLIEVDERLGPQESYRSIVTFLHKTVSEFLREKEVWPSLLTLTSTSNFEVNLSLLYSCIRRIRESLTRINAEEKFDRIDYVFKMVQYVVLYANAVGLNSRGKAVSMLYQLGLQLSERHMGAVRNGIENWLLSIKDLNDHLKPLCLLLEPTSDVWFVALASLLGCFFYLESRLQGVPTGLSTEQQTSLLAQAVLWTFFDEAAGMQGLRTLRYILRYPSADPNAQIILDRHKTVQLMYGHRMSRFLSDLHADYKQPCYTAWKLVLMYLDRKEQDPHGPEPRERGGLPNRPIRVASAGWTRKWLTTNECFLVYDLNRARSERLCEVIKLLIQQGADVNEICLVSKISGILVTRSALTIVLRLRDRLMHVCDDRDFRRLLEGHERDYVQENFEGVITLMKQRGAEEKGTDKHQPDARLVSNTFWRSPEDIEVDPPAPPYSMDLGPDMFYTMPGHSSNTSKPSTASKRPGIRSRIGKLRRSLTPSNYSTSSK